MLAKPAESVVWIIFVHFTNNLLESKMDDVMVVNFQRSYFPAEAQP